MDDIAGSKLQQLANDWNQYLKEPFFVDANTIVNKFGLSFDPRNTIIAEWDKKLMGSAANRRLLNYFEYMLISHTMPNVSENTITAKGARHSNGVDSFDTSAIIISLARTEVTNAVKGIHWFLRGIKGISDLGLNVVLDHLLRPSGKYNLLARNAIVRSEMTGYYQSAVQRLLDRIRRRWEEDIAIHSSFISMDLPIKKLMSVLISPQEQIVRPFDAYNIPPFPVNGDDEVNRKMKGAGSTSWSWMGYGSVVSAAPGKVSSSDKSVSVPPSLSAIDEDGAKYQMSRRVSESSSQRWIDVHGHIIYVRGEVISRVQGGVGPLDYTNAGHVSMPSFEHLNHDRKFLQSAATEYYIAVMDTLINNLDVTVKAFYESELAKSKNRFLSPIQMLQRIRQRGSNSPSGLMAVLGVNYNELVQQQKEFEDSRDKLLQVQFYLQEVKHVL
jgi:hypothetical protein